LIRKEVVDRFGYDLESTVEDIRPSYGFDVSCQGTVPQAIIAFLDSNSYEDAVRNAISLGGDSDTLACITGGIAEAYYGTIGPRILDEVAKRLTAELWQITEQFCRTYKKQGRGSARSVRAEPKPPSDGN
jgi:ADP-ribosylglycohydrolase